MPIPKLWLLLAGCAVAIANFVTMNQSFGSDFSSGTLPTRAVLSHTIVEEATLITSLSIETTTSSIASNSAKISEIKPSATPTTVEGRTATELDPSLQIVFLVLGTLFGLASVVVAVFFGYKQLKITTNQPNVHIDDDVELGELDIVSDQAHTTTDLATGNSRPANEEFIRTFETGIVHLSNALAFRLVAIWSFVRHAGQRSPLGLAPPCGRLGEPPNAGHEQHIHPGTVHV
jgi:hypothetical protein